MLSIKCDYYNDTYVNILNNVLIEQALITIYIIYSFPSLEKTI